MGPIDFIILAVIGLILGGAAGFVWRSKKKGVKCIGCPGGPSCSGKCSGCGGNCSSCGSNHHA